MIFICAAHQADSANPVSISFQYIRLPPSSPKTTAAIRDRVSQWIICLMGRATVVAGTVDVNFPCASSQNPAGNRRPHWDPADAGVVLPARRCTVSASVKRVGRKSTLPAAASAMLEGLYRTLEIVLHLRGAHSRQRSRVVPRYTLTQWMSEPKNSSMIRLMPPVGRLVPVHHDFLDDDLLFSVSKVFITETGPHQVREQLNHLAV